MPAWLIGVSAIAVIAAAIYLVYVLIRPERF